MKPRRNRELWQVAHKFSESWVGAILGIPACLLTLVLSSRGTLVGSNRHIIFLGLCYFAWIVIPAAACLSAAMCACPPTEATRSQAMKAILTILGIWAFLLVLMAAVVSGLALQYKSIVGVMRCQDVESLIVLGVAVPVLAAGCWVGFRLGVAAQRDRQKPLGHFLGRCWNFTGTDAETSQV